MRYIIKRLLMVIPIMISVVVIVFTLTYIAPGDPVSIALGEGYTQEQYDAMAAYMGLDKSFIEQLISYFVNLFTKFSFGKSYFSVVPIEEELASRFPVTAMLGLSGIALTVLIGIPLGVFSAIKQYSVLDYTLTTIALIMAAIPGFVLAILSIVLFGVKLRWLPFSGLDTPKHWILPIATSAFPGIASMMRMTRTTMLEVIRQDYITTARSKGLKENIIIVKHALKNCMIPLITVIGGSVAMVMTGSIISENIFSIRGIGTYMYSGISSRDYPVVMAGVLVTSFIVCVVNILVDVLYAFVDPRIKTIYGTRKMRRKKPAVTPEAESEVV